MYSGINFLKERNRLQELVLIRDKKIAQITSIVLGVFLFVAVALLAFQFYLGARLSAILSAESVEQRKIQSLSNVQTTFIAVSKRINTINGIFAKRSNKWDAIAFFYNLLPLGASINSVDLQSDTSASQLSFSIEAPSVFIYDQLSQIIQSDVVAKSGFTIQLGSLARNKDGSYRIDVTLSNAKAAVSPTP